MNKERKQSTNGICSKCGQTYVWKSMKKINNVNYLTTYHCHCGNSWSVEREDKNYAQFSSLPNTESKEKV